MSHKKKRASMEMLKDYNYNFFRFSWSTDNLSSKDLTSAFFSVDFRFKALPFTT